jgi:hypothetical protein
MPVIHHAALPHLQIISNSQIQRVDATLASEVRQCRPKKAGQLALPLVSVDVQTPLLR